MKLRKFVFGLFANTNVGYVCIKQRVAYASDQFTAEQLVRQMEEESPNTRWQFQGEA